MKVKPLKWENAGQNLYRGIGVGEYVAVIRERAGGERPFEVWTRLMVYRASSLDEAKQIANDHYEREWLKWVE